MPRRWTHKTIEMGNCQSNCSCPCNPNCLANYPSWFWEGNLLYFLLCFSIVFNRSHYPETIMHMPENVWYFWSMVSSLLSCWQDARSQLDYKMQPFDFCMAKSHSHISIWINPNPGPASWWLTKMGAFCVNGSILVLLCKSGLLLVCFVEMG